MKILGASQLAELDQFSIDLQNISSWDLMERASRLAFLRLKSILPISPYKVYILAGPGNNGGDGLAIANFLTLEGVDVEVILVNYTETRSEDNQRNLHRLKDAKVKIIDFNKASKLSKITSEDVVIDAIFGVGLNRSMPDFVQDSIQYINSVSPLSISIDVPSGMFLDRIPATNEQVFQSDYTYTFQTPKLSLFLPDYANSVGHLDIIDIGLNKDILNSLPSDLTYVDLKAAKKLYRLRSRFSHKGTYGHAVLVGGSQLMLGSIILAAKSCMRSGVGKTSVMMPNKAHLTMIQHQPEVMLIDNPSSHFISYQSLEFEPNSVGIGVGIGTSTEAFDALKSWLVNSKSPLVIDADALNLIAKHENLLDFIPKKSILTPHPGELKRLIGEWKDDFDKLNKIKSFSKRLDVIILAKEAYSLCIYKDQIYVNSTGNSGMATAGSGDVLTGLITGLLAQKYSSMEAAIIGMFLHGLAGDLALKLMSEESLIASDLIDQLGHSFLKLKD
jgi:hydroxyethylthiazole kinase-like uncharacterized protein yjeF